MGGEAEIEGGCRCGAIRYVVARKSLPKVYACHCTDCQTWSGSAFSLQFMAPETALSVRGEPAIYELTTPSGRISRQRVCGVCHTRLYNTNSARPGFPTVRAGTLDRSNELVAVGHIWVRSKQPWVVIPPDAPTWAESWTGAEMARTLAD